MSFGAHTAGVNAVQIACDIVSYLSTMAHRFRAEGGFDHAYDVPYTTVHTGVIRGGTALNIVPAECEFLFEFRYLPFDDPDELLRSVERYAMRFLSDMREVSVEAGVSFEQIADLPGLDQGLHAEITKFAEQLLDTSDAGKVSFGSEASKFAKAGVPAVICGPGHIEQAHQPNEWVSIEQLSRCEEFMRRLVDRLCS